MSVCVCKAEILQANDSLTQVINLYRQLVKGEEVNGDSSTMPTRKCNCTSELHTHTTWYQDVLKGKTKSQFGMFTIRSCTSGCLMFM